MPQFNLNQLRLKNFRAFSELTKINFGSRITLIFGKGSVGKSTIIDAINILSSSYKNKNFREHYTCDAKWGYIE